MFLCVSYVFSYVFCLYEAYRPRFGPKKEPYRAHIVMFLNGTHSRMCAGPGCVETHFVDVAEGPKPARSGRKKVTNRAQIGLQ